MDTQSKKKKVISTETFYDRSKFDWKSLPNFLICWDFIQSQKSHPIVPRPVKFAHLIYIKIAYDEPRTNSKALAKLSTAHSRMNNEADIFIRFIKPHCAAPRRSVVILPAPWINIWSLSASTSSSFSSPEPIGNGKWHQRARPGRAGRKQYQ